MAGRLLTLRLLLQKKTRTDNQTSQPAFSASNYGYDFQNNTCDQKFENEEVSRAFEKINSVSFTRSINIHLSKSLRDINTFAPIIHGKSL